MTSPLPVSVTQVPTSNPIDSGIVGTGAFFGTNAGFEGSGDLVGARASVSTNLHPFILLGGGLLVLTMIMMRDK